MKIFCIWFWAGVGFYTEIGAAVFDMLWRDFSNTVCNHVPCICLIMSELPLGARGTETTHKLQIIAVTHSISYLKICLQSHLNSNTAHWKGTSTFLYSNPSLRPPRWLRSVSNIPAAQSTESSNEQNRKAKIIMTFVPIYAKSVSYCYD